MDLTVENMCGLLIRSKLLTPDGVKTMYQRWQNESKGATGNVAQFSKWLVTNQFVTAYQSSLLARGYADNFFCNEYKILDRLGQGRMAGVYRAVHSLGQVVAIKVLPPSKAKDSQMFARFQREARLALCLKHANVVRTFHLGEANGLHYIVMEYLEGETLEEVLNRRGKLPAAEGVRLGYQALLGLQHLHEQGLVHRDLKPSNLMLVPASPRGGPHDNTFRATVKVLDIGLGRALFDEDTHDSLHDHQLTGEGMLLGTPDYLAPEQARDAHKSDIRADIYSLGCVLYHVLTGQPPFPDTNIISQMVRHATETPKPLKELNPAVPDGLQPIMQYLLAKHPAQRYQTPAQAATALQMFLPAGLAEAQAAPEADAQMRNYLRWLEGKSSGVQPRPATPAAPAPPASTPVAASTPTPPSPARQGLPVGQPVSGLPVGQPVGAVPVGQPVAAPPDGPKRKRKKHRRKERRAAPSPGGADLVASSTRRRFGLTPRDWFFLALGAGGVLLALFLGMWLGKGGGGFEPQN